MDTAWHIADTPSGVWVHRLDPMVARDRARELIAEAATHGHTLPPQDALASAREEWVLALLAGLGFPPRHWWMSVDGWDSFLTFGGEPHPSLINRCLNARDADGRPDVDTVPVAQVTPESSVRTPQAWVTSLAPPA